MILNGFTVCSPSMRLTVRIRNSNIFAEVSQLCCNLCLNSVLSSLNCLKVLLLT